MYSTLNVGLVIGVIQIHQFISHAQAKELENTW